MSDENAGGEQVCSIDGCINESFSHGYCEDCLNDMGHAALDLAEVCR